MTTEEIVTQLQNRGNFVLWSYKDVKKFVDLDDLTSHKKSDIIRKNQNREEIYVVMDGSVTIRINGIDILQFKRKGDIIFFNDLYDSGYLDFEIVANEPTKIMRVSHADVVKDLDLHELVRKTAVSAERQCLTRLVDNYQVLSTTVKTHIIISDLILYPFKNFLAALNKTYELMYEDAEESIKELIDVLREKSDEYLEEINDLLLSQCILFETEEDMIDISEIISHIQKPNDIEKIGQREKQFLKKVKEVIKPFHRSSIFFKNITKSINNLLRK